MRTQRNTTHWAAQRSQAFTLIELLIVVVILGILAAVIIPQFSNASVEARENMVRENLRILRTQIGIYKAQHDDVAPGYPNGDPANVPTEAAFIDQMTNPTDINGDSAAANTPFGPYLRNIPENPINGLSSVEVLDIGDPVPAIGNDSHGWVFIPSIYILRADTAELDTNGDRYYDY